MHRRFLLFGKAFLLLLISMFFACRPQQSTILEGRAVKIQDGDTFDLRTKNETVRIRLYGIDCPERGQDFSKLAKKTLIELLNRKKITAYKRDTDRYGRTVAIVYADRKCVNETMLTLGLAWHYTRYDQNPEWAKMEKQAASLKVGLWSTADPTPPWDWRAARK